MGAWGEGPLDSDQALDWVGNNVSDPLVRAISQLIESFDRSCEKYDGDVSMYAHELRGAGEIIRELNLPFYDHRDDITGQVIERLKIIRDSSWIGDWSDPDAARNAIDFQITTLEKMRENPGTTSLLANLEAAQEAN